MAVKYVLDETETTFVPADAITQHPRNPNNGDVEEIIHSIRANGCYRPIHVSRETGHILAGHHLYTALLSLGEERVPVNYVNDLTPDDELRIVLVDNHSATLGWVDDGLVLDILNDIGTDGTSYTEDEMLEMKAAQATGFGPGALEDYEDDREEDYAFARPVDCPECGHHFTIKSDLV